MQIGNLIMCLLFHTIKYCEVRIMEYKINSSESPLIFEYDGDKKIIIFIDGKVVENDSKIKCICDFICNGFIKILNFFLKRHK